MNNYDVTPARYVNLEVVEMPKNNSIRAVLSFSAEVLYSWAVIVETWEHKRYGRGKRLYYQTFTKAERKLIGKFHTRLWNWTMRQGFPNNVVMSGKTFDLMTRAAYFFASI